VGDATERAYARSDALKQRRELMNCLGCLLRAATASRQRYSNGESKTNSRVSEIVAGRAVIPGHYHAGISGVGGVSLHYRLDISPPNPFP